MIFCTNALSTSSKLNLPYLRNALFLDGTPQTKLQNRFNRPNNVEKFCHSRFFKEKKFTSVFYLGPAVPRSRSNFSASNTHCPIISQLLQMSDSQHKNFASYFQKHSLDKFFSPKHHKTAVLRGILPYFQDILPQICRLLPIWATQSNTQHRLCFT